MEYKTPKEFVNKIDQTFLKFVSVPILFFFVYYCYFSYYKDIGGLFKPDLNDKVLLFYIVLWIVPIVVFLRRKKKMLSDVKAVDAMDSRLNLLLSRSIKNYFLLFVLFIISILVFCFTNHPFMSLPVWAMVIITSVEKPSIYRVGDMLRFETKEKYQSFINDEWS